MKKQTKKPAELSHCNKGSATMHDPVTNPAHYTRNGVELIDLIDSLPYCRGAAIKYIYRAGVKDPAKEIEDLRKAAWMIDRELLRLTKA